MKKAHILFVALILAFLFSCEYEPSGVYNRTVNLNVNPPHIQTVVLNLDEDTIFLYSSEIINFEFQSSDQEIMLVRLLIDKMEVEVVNNYYGQFTVNIDNLNEGNHIMEIEIMTRTGTGSIADSCEAEGFLFLKSWTLIIEKIYLGEPKTNIKDGLLQITWNKYLASNFIEYIVYRKINITEEVEINRVSTPEYIDSSYVGENAVYSIYVHTKNNILYIAGYAYLDPDFPDIYFSIEDTNRYTFRWTKSKYYNALDNYLVFQATEEQSTYELQSNQNPFDTVYHVINAYFGDLLTIRLRLVPKKINLQYETGNYSDFETNSYGRLGYEFPATGFVTTDYQQVKDDEFIYISHCYDVIRFSVSQRRVTEDIQYPPKDCSTCDFVCLQASPTGKYVTVNVDCDRDIMFTKGDSLHNYSIHHLQSITNGAHSYIAVSDNGIGLVRSMYGGFEMYDFVNHSSLGHYNESDWSNTYDGLKISALGNYFLIRGNSLHLVQFKDSVFNEIWKVSKTNTQFFEFDPLDSSRFVYWDGSLFSVKTCNDLAPVYEFALYDDYLLDIDYYNKEILSYNTGHLYIRDYENGIIIKDIPVNIQLSNRSSETCYLLHNTIVYSKGRANSVTI